MACQSSSSYCRIPMIFDTLKSELKPSFTAETTEGFLLHADKNGEHFCEEKMHNGNENGEHICGENLHGDNLNPHTINKLSCSYQNPQETQHLCLPEVASVLLDLNINVPRSMNPLKEDSSSITMLGMFSTLLLA